jgi:adenosylmethionine-8-amino-7-oxononanoate aminotransferase
MSLAATLCTPRVARASPGLGPVLAHGPTFMGNPLACAVALASLSVLSDPAGTRAAGRPRWRAWPPGSRPGWRRPAAVRG